MQRRDLTLLQKGIIMIAVPIVFEVIFVLILGGLIIQSFHDENVALWRRDLVEEADNLFLDCLHTGTSVLFYGATKDKSKAEKFESLKQSIKDRFVKLEGNTRGDKRAIESLAEAKDLINKNVEVVQSIKEQIDKGAKNPLQFMNMMKRQAVLFSLVKQVRVLQKKIDTPNVKEEQRARARHQQDRKLVIASLAGGLILNIGMAMAVAVFFSRQIAGRLAVISSNTHRLAKKEELLAPQEGIDEVATLDRTFHTMVEALKAAQAKEKEIINNSQDVICSIADGKFGFVSQAAERVWNMAADSVMGKPLAAIVDKADLERLEQYLANLKQGGEPRPCDARIVGSGGSVDTSWAAHWSQPNQSFFCVVHDNTSQKERERVKQRFVNLISKRLSEPLQGLEVDLRSIKETGQSQLSARGKNALNSSLTSLDRITQLVEELLELETMSGGVLTLRIAPCAVTEILNSAKASLESIAEFKNVKLTVDQTDSVINADGKRLTQVLVNLMSNALKYTGEGTNVSVEVSQTNGETTISVLDEGPGIPPEALGSLFARFKRLERDVDRKQQGTGLGLAICRAIIEEHSGRIAAENRPQGGSRFYFSIPDEKPQPSPIMTQAAQ